MRVAIISALVLFFCTYRYVVAMDLPVPALPDAPHIVITGEGSVEADADYLELTVSVTIGDADSIKAKEAVEVKLVAVADALIEFGLDEGQMKVGATSVDVKYDWQQSPPKRLGTQVSRGIDISVSKIDQLDEIIRIATEAGATNIGRPVLRSTRETEFAEQAQDRAVANARERAEKLANQFGRSLGPVWGIATEETRYWSWYGGGSGAGSGGGGGGLFGEPSAIGRRSLRYSPTPVTHYTSVYVVYLLGPALDESGE